MMHEMAIDICWAPLLARIAYQAGNLFSTRGGLGILVIRIVTALPPGYSLAVLGEGGSSNPSMVKDLLEVYVKYWFVRTLVWCALPRRRIHVPELLVGILPSSSSSSSSPAPWFGRLVSVNALVV